MLDLSRMKSLAESIKKDPWAYRESGRADQTVYSITPQITDRGSMSLESVEQIIQTRKDYPELVEWIESMIAALENYTKTQYTASCTSCSIAPPLAHGKYAFGACGKPCPSANAWDEVERLLEECPHA